MGFTFSSPRLERSDYRGLKEFNRIIPVGNPLQTSYPRSLSRAIFLFPILNIFYIGIKNNYSLSFVFLRSSLHPRFAMKKQCFVSLIILSVALFNACEDDSSSTKQECSAGESKCLDNATLAKCNESGTWDTETCENGCDADAASCIYPDKTCKDGETKCTNDVYSVCQSGTWKDETCKAGCDKNGCKEESNKCEEGDPQCEENQKCEEDSIQCSEDGTALMICKGGSWTETDTCDYGCDADEKACNPFCKEDAHKCDGEDGQSGTKVMICHNEQWEESDYCEYGCVAGSCSTACDEEGAYVCKGDTLMVCHGNWEIDPTCTLGCDNNKCKQCTTVDEKSCNDANNVQTCQSDYSLLETDICELGCFEGKCKQCADPGSSSCNDADNIQTCQSDYTLLETANCPHGCKDAACLECQADADCASVPGWKAGKCNNNTCEATSCKGNYLLQGTSCTLEIPFAGNVFVTEMENNAEIIEKAGNILWDYPDDPTHFVSWKNPKETISFFFAPKTTGKMRLFVEGFLPQNTTKGTLSFTYKGESHEITIDSTQTKVYDLGTWEVKEPGYVRIDVRSKSVTPENAEFARFGNFFVGGDVASEMPACTPKSVINDAYWNRRGPSVHMGYTMPSGKDVEWFYNEVIVSKDNDILNAYYMLTGFSEGYMGIQVNSPTERKVLFSVWSAYSTDDPNQIPADYKVTVLRKGENVEPKEFGNEGSGMQSFYTYPWVTDKTYKTLVHIKPTGNGSTDYTGYFCDEKGVWHLLASFRRPKTNTWYKGAHSFLENYNPAGSIYPREVHFTNPWMRTKDGEWIEVTEATLTADTAGTKEYRVDRDGSSSGSEFILKNCGFFLGTTPIGSKFTREKSGKPAPEIDCDALEKL